MTRAARVARALCLGICLASSRADAQGASAAAPARRSAPLWGRLEPGPHAVGFRTLLLRDVSRPALPLSDSTVAPSTPRGRQMPVYVWYPARPERGTAMSLAGYVHELARSLDFSPPTTARRRAAESDWVAQAGGLGGDSAALRRALPSLLALPTAARRDAPPAAGRFPLYLYPAYRAPSVNHVLAEYLASHGYVVASVALHGTFGDQPDISTMGLETQSDDLRFAIAALDSLRFVDAERLGVGGVGINASGALALAMRTPALDAFVSLEGGTTTEGEIAMIRRSPFFDVASLRVPMLAINAPHPDVDANRLDLYRYARRHLVHFPRMGEFWFLDWGMLERRVPGVIGRAPGDTELGFEWAARYVHRFLDAYLRDDRSALDFVRATPAANGVPDSVLVAETRDELPAPPSLGEMRRIVRRDGVAGLRALVDARRARDSQPIPAERLVALHGWLGQIGDPGFRARRELAELRVSMYPASARAHFTLGSVASQASDTTAARRHLGEALRLLGSDPDPLLDAATRARAERQARAILQRLGG